MPFITQLGDIQPTATVTYRFFDKHNLLGEFTSPYTGKPSTNKTIHEFITALPHDVYMTMEEHRFISNEGTHLYTVFPIDGKVQQWLWNS